MFKENAYSDLITALEKIRQGEAIFAHNLCGMAEIIRNEMSSNFIPKSLSAKEIRVLT